MDLYILELGMTNSSEWGLLSNLGILGTSSMGLVWFERVHFKPRNQSIFLKTVCDNLKRK